MPICRRLIWSNFLPIMTMLTPAARLFPQAPTLLLAGLATLATVPLAQANGIFRNGVGARSMALGGASVGLTDGPLEALAGNPAQMALAPATSVQLGAVAGWGEGDFANAADSAGRLREKLGVMPELGLSLPVNDRLTVGLAAVPDAAATVDWNFTDAPGGLDGVTSYGRQLHRSEILVHRTAVGFSYAISDRIAIGSSVGMLYNRNVLRAPYIFQSHPALRGFKTALDLETSGLGVNGTVGLLMRPNDTLTLSLSYQTESRLDSDGSATGNAGAQLTSLGGGFAGVRPDFRYDATVENVFPQQVSAGISWQARPWLRAVVQVDWIDWSGAFSELPIHLTNGNNADLNGFLGSNAIDDTVPLNWRDRVVVRTGLEFAVSEAVTLRAGYAFGDNPVPAATLTPMTAAIARHTLSAGAEWRRGRFSLAGAYQHDLPSTVVVGTSGLAGGEYSGTRTQVGLHWVALTAGYQF